MDPIAYVSVLMLQALIMGFVQAIPMAVVIFAAVYLQAKLRREDD